MKRGKFDGVKKAPRRGGVRETGPPSSKLRRDELGKEGNGLARLRPDPEASGGTTARQGKGVTPPPMLSGGVYVTWSFLDLMLPDATFIISFTESVSYFADPKKPQKALHPSMGYWSHGLIKFE